MEHCPKSKTLSITDDQDAPLDLSTTKSSVHDDNIEGNISNSNNTSNDSNRSTSENASSSSTLKNLSLHKRINNLKENDAMNLLKKMPQKALMEICKYRPNMVRYVPPKKRSPKDQQRRNNNTIACRKSRRVKKLHHMVEEEKYKLLNEQYRQILREQARAVYYVDSLSKWADSRLIVSGINITQNIKYEPDPELIKILKENIVMKKILNGIKKFP